MTSVPPWCNFFRVRAAAIIDNCNESLVRGGQTRRWSAFADHDGGEVGACRLALLPPAAGRRLGLWRIMALRRPGVGRTEGRRVAGGEGFLGRLIHELVILRRSPLVPETHDRMLPSCRIAGAGQRRLPTPLFHRWLPGARAQGEAWPAEDSSKGGTPWLLSTNKRILLARRPEGMPKPERFPHRGGARPRAEGGRGPAAHSLPFPRSLSARAHERRQILCPVGGDRPCHGGRHRGRGGGIPAQGFRQGRHRPLLFRLADPCDLRRQGSAQARSGRRPRHHGAGHPGHAGLHGLCGAADHRQAQAG